MDELANIKRAINDLTDAIKKIAKMYYGSTIDL